MAIVAVRGQLDRSSKPGGGGCPHDETRSSAWGRVTFGARNKNARLQKQAPARVGADPRLVVRRRTMNRRGGLYIGLQV